MKTAMQELYLELEKIKEISDTISITDIQRMIGNHYNDIEKEQINDAYFEGNEDGYNQEEDYDSENLIDYYEETYKK
jgi:hypothetical protein